jgi:hypothetical protein
MAPPEVGRLKANQIDTPGNISTWIITLLACAYFAFSGISLYYSTGVFLNMFNSMGVELHLSSKIVIASYHYLYPVLFGGAAAVVIIKQFFVQQKWINLSITLATAFLVGLISNEIVRALYRPIFDLQEKLGK